MIQILLLLALLLGAAPSWATIRYADNTLAANCTSGNYSVVNRDCTGSDGDAYNTPAGVIAQTVAGDEIVVRGGIWDVQWDFQVGNKSGTVGNYITMRGHTGERPIYKFTSTLQNGYGAIKVRGNRGYFKFSNFIYDAVNTADYTGWQIRDGNHHFIIEDFEMKNVGSTGLLMREASNITVRNCSIHDMREDLTPQRSRHYGVYPGTTDTVTIENCDIYNNPGGGINTNATAGTTNLIIRNNRIHHNGWMDNTPVGGITLYEVPGGNLDGAQIYNNVVYENSLTNPLVGGGHGIVVGQGTTNTKVWNNTVYGNKGYGINMQSGSSGPPTNTAVLNNIVTGNLAGQTVDAGTGTTFSNNACLSGDVCGTTGKVTISSSTACFVNAAADDYRLKQGTNPCRDSGIDIASRPTAVGIVDIGAYEQGKFFSASVVGDQIEIITDVSTPGVLPTTGISGISIACVGCTGTPVAVSTAIKSGSNNVIKVGVSGITTSGTCTLSVGSTNATDSSFIGGDLGGTAQGINSVTGLSVTGTCVNSGAIPNPSGSLWSHFPLSEGSGTVANDDSGAAHHGTVSAGVTWVNDTTGTGVTFPTGTTYRQVTSTYGSGINPTTQGFGVCAYVQPILTGNSQKAVISSGTNGSNQRAYVGWYTVAGQVQWGLGAQASPFFSGSEFIATESKTFICMVGDPATDTLTLWVNGVKGSVAGQSVKSVTSYTLTGNFIAGNEGTNTVNNGGSTVYEMWVWNAKPADSDITTLYNSINPTNTIANLSQTHRAFQHPYLTSGLATIALTPKADGSVDVVQGGGVAFVVQYTCTGGACPSLAPRLWYSTDGGTTYPLAVPQSIGTDGVAMWGANDEIYFNDDQVAACLNTAGLTSHVGITISNSTAGSTFSLSQNHCRADRYVVRFGSTVRTYKFRVIADTGGLFQVGYPQDIVVNVVAGAATGAP